MWTARTSASASRLLIIASGSLNAKIIGELPCRFGGASGNTDNFYVAQAA